MDIANLYSKYLETGKVSTDTRQIGEGSVFFALKGERFDANQFADEAISKGASYAVIDNPAYRKDDRYIVVDDTLASLQELARYHRSKLSIPVIGLTGSNGKTTSKELVNVVLAKKFRTHATRGNLNNHIGVPLTLLAIDSNVEIAIVEMGANHLGEIALLCSIANPTHGFITNIGKAHIGTFGGYENIIRGKSELFDHLLKTGGTVFINSQNPIFQNMARRFKSAVFYPAKGDFYQASLVSADPMVIVRTEDGVEIKTNLIGGYNFENIASALCIGKFFGVPSGEANQAVASYTPANMRSQVLKKASNTIILDAYNANPSSMEAAIKNISEMNAVNKVLILGDMFELEEEADKEHQAIGRLIKEKGFSHVYLCGYLFKSALREIPEAKYFTKKEELAEELKQFPVKNSTVLVKASRGIGLETIVDYL